VSVVSSCPCAKVALAALELRPLATVTYSAVSHCSYHGRMEVIVPKAAAHDLNAHVVSHG
jgi:hypothetical protein